MLNQNLIKTIFIPASMKRWNDQASPIEFYELDKQAHKVFIAYLLAKFQESDKNIKIDWNFLIEGIIFEYLERAILTDIKPPIFYKLQESQSKELTEYVLKKVDLDIKDRKFKEKMKNYLNSKNSDNSIERRILKASHFLASKWEFDIIHNFNDKLYQVKEIKESLENQIEEFFDLIGIQRVMLNRQSSKFINAIGQLRFQLRWSQTPRIPKTSVLGHTLTVAIFSYFLSKEIKICDRRVYNNFFGGMFHDLPEILTRDIISPIKYSIKGLDISLSKIEKELIESKILPLLPKHMHKEIKYFVFDEFSNKIESNSKIEKIKDIREMQKFNKKRFNAIDGNLLKICDHLSAFYEAKISIEYGIKSKDLKSASKELHKKYLNREDYGLNLKELFSLK